MCQQNGNLHEGIQMESKEQSPLEEDILSRDVNKAIEEAHTLPNHTKKFILLSY